MTEVGLRERKKARTRRLIADTAARLFAERGYEQVAVSDVARAAEVSEQTVYNYFQTKEQLVTDLHGHFEEELDRLIRTRDPGTSPAAGSASEEGRIGVVAPIQTTTPSVLFPSRALQGKYLDERRAERCAHESAPPRLAGAENHDSVRLRILRDALLRSAPQSL